MNKKITRDHFSPLIENFIIIAIALVIGHTILEDIGHIYTWSHSTMNMILVIGFFFDLFFTGEFIARSLVSRKWGQFDYYLKYQRGWVDALSSIPLLLLVSGPGVLMLMLGNEGGAAGLGFFSILKTAKAIRVTRILRLIRVLKLFGKIQNTDSTMTNRHVGSISTISVVALVIVLVITQFLPFARIGDHHEVMEQRVLEVTSLVESAQDNPEWIVQYIKKSQIHADIIELRKKDGNVIYAHPDKEEMMHSAYGSGHYIPVGSEYEMILSHFPADAMHARANMIIYLSILSLILAIMIFYSRIFVQQVSDPAYVMTQGFKDWDYNLAVKDNENYSDEEIFQLVRLYNVKWLPLKNQIRAHRSKKARDNEKSSIKMDDLF